MTTMFSLGKGSERNAGGRVDDATVLVPFSSGIDDFTGGGGAA